MRTAIISNSHGTLETLETVHRSGIEQGVDTRIFPGDVVGYGADPRLCLHQVRATAETIVLGSMCSRRWIAARALSSTAALICSVGHTHHPMACVETESGEQAIDISAGLL